MKRILFSLVALLAAVTAYPQTISNQRVLSQMGAPFNQSGAEAALSITPTNYGYPPGHPFRYMTQVQIANVLAGGTPTQDVTAALQTTINLAVSAGNPARYAVYWPPGHYLISSLNIPLGSNIDIGGAGRGTVLYATASGASPMINWNQPTCCLVAKSHIHDLMLEGLGSLAHMISLVGISNLWIDRLILQDIPVGFDGVFINGSNSTVMHEVHLRDIEAVQTTAAAGNAVVEFGPLGADSDISRLVSEQNIAVLYGIVLDSGATNITLEGNHISNAATSSLLLTGSNNAVLSVGNYYDRAFGDIVSIGASSVDVHFVGDRMVNIQSGHNGITIASSTQVVGTSLDFSCSSGCNKVVETGSSDFNTFSQIVTQGTFNATPVTLTGLNSAFRPLGGSTYFAGIGANLAAASTTYVTNGGVTPSGTGQAIAQMPMATAAVVRGLTFQSVNAPGASQTYTATVYNNTNPSSCVATISGASSFGAQVGCFIPFAVGNNLSVQVVTSAGATVSNVRLSVLVDY